jgi:DNA-binding transcriptional MerR regulator
LTIIVFLSEADVARLQRLKRLKDVLGIPLSSIKRLAEVEETLDALGTALGGRLDPQQRRTRLLQARAEPEQQLHTIDERLETLTHVRVERADVSRGLSNSFTPEARRSH